jgi:recombinational DNA repair protein (RecF pathway)
MSVVRRLTDEETVPVMRSAGLEPLEPYPGSIKPWRCSCTSCGKEVRPMYNNIKKGHGGCVWCGYRKTGLGTRLAHLEALQVMKSVGLTPLEPYPTQQVPWRCRCDKCGREVSPMYKTVKRKGSGCAYCSKVRVDPAEAEALMVSKGFTPAVPYPGDAPWLSTCDRCGREVTPRYNRVKNGGGCKHCAGRDFDPEVATKLMEEAGFTPTVAFPGVMKKWLCRCKRCGCEVSTSLNHARRRKSVGCLICAGHKNDPATAVKIMESAGLEPLVPYPGANANWLCKCRECGREVDPVYNSVQAGGGCRFCSSGGFDFTAPGCLYLIRHLGFGAIKVGIAGQESNRITQHVQLGWDLLEVWDFDVGEDAYEVEQRVISWWRDDLGFGQALDKETMPQRGWTETAHVSDVGPDETIKFVDRVLDEIPAS